MALLGFKPSFVSLKEKLKNWEEFVLDKQMKKKIQKKLFLQYQQSLAEHEVSSLQNIRAETINRLQSIKHKTIS